jgi:hypothetical protein
MPESRPSSESKPTGWPEGLCCGETCGRLPVTYKSGQWLEAATLGAQCGTRTSNLCCLEGQQPRAQLHALHGGVRGREVRMLGVCAL